MLAKQLVQYMQLFCMFWCFSITQSEFNIFGLRFAILNVSTSINNKIKNIYMSDATSWKIVYGQNSPINIVNGKLVLIKSKKFLSLNQTNTTADNKGCAQYLNKDLPENYVAVIYKFFSI